MLDTMGTVQGGEKTVVCRWTGGDAPAARLGEVEQGTGGFLRPAGFRAQPASWIGAVTCPATASVAADLLSLTFGFLVHLKGGQHLKRDDLEWKGRLRKLL